MSGTSHKKPESLAVKYVLSCAAEAVAETGTIEQKPQIQLNICDI